MFTAHMHGHFRIPTSSLLPGYVEHISLPVCLQKRVALMVRLQLVKALSPSVREALHY